MWISAEIPKFYRVCLSSWAANFHYRRHCWTVDCNLLCRAIWRFSPVLILPTIRFFWFFAIKKSDEALFSKKKCPEPKLSKMGQIWPKSGVFMYFRDFESLDFSDFVYYVSKFNFLEIASLVFCSFCIYDDRQAWYLTRDGGLDGWKNILSLKPR